MVTTSILKVEFKTLDCITYSKCKSYFVEYFTYVSVPLLGFPGGSVIKNLPANAEDETWVQPPGQEDPLKEGMVTLSSIVWKIPWTEEPGGLQSMGLQTVRHTTEHACTVASNGLWCTVYFLLWTVVGKPLNHKLFKDQLFLACEYLKWSIILNTEHTFNQCAACAKNDTSLIHWLLNPKMRLCVKTYHPHLVDGKRQLRGSNLANTSK